MNPVTQVLTRNWFQTEAAKSRQFGALLIVKLEGLEWIGNLLPRNTRDLILYAVARRLETLLQPNDLLLELGWSEFAILFCGHPSSAEILRTGVRLLRLLQQNFLVEERRVQLTAAIGATIGENPTQMLQEADQALNKAKSGINRIEFYSEALKQELTLDLELRRGIHRGELRLYYQPIVELPDEKIIGMEALVRWQHPDRGLLFPDSFIEIAERTQVVEELFDWVFSTGCNQAKEWGDRQWFVSINLSPAQLGKKALKRTIDRVVRKRQISPARIYLEITETLEIRYSSEIKQQLEWLTEKGIGVELDDFGTGFSSILNLTTLPISAIKIDKCLIPADLDSKLWSVVDAMIRMAHSLEMKVIAEGVETQGQADKLKVLGCDAAQGYLWSKPKPPETFDCPSA